MLSLEDLHRVEAVSQCYENRIEFGKLNSVAHSSSFFHFPLYYLSRS